MSKKDKPDDEEKKIIYVKSFAEQGLAELSRSGEMGGIEGIKAGQNAGDIFIGMIASIEDDDGNPKYRIEEYTTEDDSTKSSDESNLYALVQKLNDPKLIPNVRQKSSSGKFDFTITVEEHLTLDVMKEQAEENLKKAYELAYIIANRRLHMVLTKLIFICGREGLLPPHTPLHDVAHKVRFDNAGKKDIRPVNRAQELFQAEWDKYKDKEDGESNG